MDTNLKNKDHPENSEWSSLDLFHGIKEA